MADLIGQRLGQYEITGLIGEGNKATVYQALQTSNSRTVAIKVIESQLAWNPDFVRRFKREAETIAALSHPHIRKLFDFGVQDDLLYLVMELMPGGSLAERIRERRLPGARVARYLDQIASALDYAHGESIIHRDLKPQNALLDKQGNAILTDFGIARLLSADAENPTASGIVMGTPAYMAPEQWHSRDIDGRADLYALGIMTYELLAGHTPFSGDTPSELMHAHVYEPPPSIRAARPELPQSVGIVLEKALAKGREARFQSGSAFAEAFRIALTGKVPAWLEQGVPPEPETANVAAGFSRRRPSRRLPARGSEMGDGRQPVSRRVGLLTIGMVMLIGAVALAMIVLATRAGDAAGQGTPTATSQLAAVPSATPAMAIPAVQTVERETSTATATATRTDASTSTPSATHTETPDLPATVAVIVAQTDTALALLPSPTPTGTPSFTPSSTPSATATETPTETPDIPATVAVIVGQTATALALLPTSTPTETPSFTPSSTSSATATDIPTETPDIPATVAVIVGQTETAVALLPSPTPTETPSFTPSATPSATATDIPTETPDIPATVAVIVGQTDTAVALLPTSTPTETPSFTPSPTFTQTLTATATPSLTATTTPTAIPTFTPSETHTKTPDIPATVAQIVGLTETAVALLPSPTLTETPSFTPSATFTSTLTATWTPNATASHTAVPATLTPAPTVPLPPTPELCEYAVEAGDYPFSIASSMGVTVEELMAANGLSNPVLLQVGQVLVNPKCASPATPPAPGGAVPAVTRNADWGHVVQAFDGVDMVLVPPGCFQMGSNRLFLDEEPVTLICFESPFWIDRFEVSNAQFERLSGVAAQPGRWNLPDRPREQISWFEARDFCTNRGARLPSEAEWEYAARGPDGLTWPWGHTFQPENVVYGENSGGETVSVGSRPEGASWVGALDMSGNVREWVSSLYMPYPYRNDDGREADTVELANSPRVLRGGTLDLLNGTDGSVRAMRRAWSGPNYGSETDGFRCARDFVPAGAPPATEATIVAPTDPSAIGARVIITGTSVNLRAGPGTTFARLSGALRGETFPVIGRTATGNWYQVALPDGSAAWVSAGLAQLSPPDAPVPEVTGTPDAGG